MQRKGIYKFLNLYIFGEKAEKPKPKKTAKKSTKKKSSTRISTKFGCVTVPNSFGDEKYGEILSKFLSGKYTLKELACAHGISINTLYNRAEREHWDEFRRNYRETVVKKTFNRLSNEDAKKLKDLMLGCDMLNELIKNCLADPEQQFLYEDVNGDFKKQIKINTKYLMEMSMLLEKQTKVTSQLYGILTETEAQKIALEQGKVEARLNAGRADESDKSGIILLPQRIEDEDE